MPYLLHVNVKAMLDNTDTKFLLPDSPTVPIRNVYEFGCLKRPAFEIKADMLSCSAKLIATRTKESEFQKA